MIGRESERESERVNKIVTEQESKKSKKSHNRV